MKVQIWSYLSPALLGLLQLFAAYFFGTRCMCKERKFGNCVKVVSKSLKGGGWVPHSASQLLGEWTSGGKKFLLSSSLGPHCFYHSILFQLNGSQTHSKENKGGSSIIPKGVFCRSTKHFHWVQLWELTSTPTFLKCLNFKLFRDPVEQRTPDRCGPGFLIVGLDLQVGTGAVAVRPIGSSWGCSW